MKQFLQTFNHTQYHNLQLHDYYILQGCSFWILWKDSFLDTVVSFFWLAKPLRNVFAKRLHTLALLAKHTPFEL